MSTLNNSFNNAPAPSEAEKFLAKQGIKFKKQPDGMIVVPGSIGLNGSSFTRLPDLSKVIVEGSFSCASCPQLTSLKGAPARVGLDFSCDDCAQLSSLHGAPAEVGRSFYCSNCPQLISLEGSPESVYHFYCYMTGITSLRGATASVSGHFSCFGCPELVSLAGAPASLGGNFDCRNCPKLVSLEGAPAEAGGSFRCNDCPQLSHLEHAPQKFKKLYSDIGDFHSWNEIPPSLRISPANIRKITRRASRGINRAVPAAKPIKIGGGV